VVSSFIELAVENDTKVLIFDSGCQWVLTNLDRIKVGDVIRLFTKNGDPINVNGHLCFIASTIPKDGKIKLFISEG
jgi:hypothetical protein